jgi:hypothetical protein
VEVYHLPYAQSWARPASLPKPRPAVEVPRPVSARETVRPGTSPARRAGRTPHRLTSSQQAALRELVACGAELHDDFTAEDLRKTFRSLAQRYHPDRHPGAGSDEHRRLAATFSRVNEGYRLLLKKVS